MTQLTELLGRIQAGDLQARDALFASAYSELHRLAHARLRDGGRNTVLDTTCLVHESYLRFVRAGELRAEDHRAFFAARRSDRCAERPVLPGRIAYELLTGTRPYRLKSAASIGALDQAVATIEVRRPSLQLEQSAGTTRASTALQCLSRGPAQLQIALSAREAGSAGEIERLIADGTIRS